MRKTMQRLSGQDFRKVRKPKTIDVEIPEWGGFVTVQEMSAAQRDEFDEFVLTMRESNKVQGLRTKVVSICVVDEEGKRVFTELDVPDLQKQSAKVIGKVADAAMKLSGLSDEDVEDMAKNLPAAQDGGSSSDSAESLA
jgi:hypothetical protein